MTETKGNKYTIQLPVELLIKLLQIKGVAEQGKYLTKVIKNKGVMQ